MKFHASNKTYKETIMRFGALNKMNKQYHALVEISNAVERLISLIDNEHLRSDLPTAVRSHLAEIEIRLKDVE
ncbi:hypothetical protein LCGC14_0235670 [marine sediment metagenome]|uniref:Uncharacterized protein n=1 Tax=marine sediment metagenome TaxID=412755 RepID=A0A0F9WTS6_9ZZZZ